MPGFARNDGLSLAMLKTKAASVRRILSYSRLDYSFFNIRGKDGEGPRECLDFVYLLDRESEKYSSGNEDGGASDSENSQVFSVNGGF